MLALLFLTVAMAGESGPAGLPIINPFAETYKGDEKDPSQTIIMRVRKADRSVELELPPANNQHSDYVIPVAKSLHDAETRAPAADTGPSPTEKDIFKTFAPAVPHDISRLEGIEEGLGLVQTDDQAPTHDKGYLLSMDHMKELYRQGRYEIALLECDGMIRVYPTDPQLHLMKGTLLDRIKKPELAMKSWVQAARLNPGDARLQRFLERMRKKAVP